MTAALMRLLALSPTPTMLCRHHLGTPLPFRPFSSILAHDYNHADVCDTIIVSITSPMKGDQVTTKTSTSKNPWNRKGAGMVGSSGDHTDAQKTSNDLSAASEDSNHMSAHSATRYAHHITHILIY